MRVALEALEERVERAAGPAEGAGRRLAQLRRAARVRAREEQQQLEDVPGVVAVHVRLAEPDVRLANHLLEEGGAPHAHDRRLLGRRGAVAEPAVGPGRQDEADGAAAREHRVAEAEEEAEAGARDEAHLRVAREGLPRHDRPAAAERLDGADGRGDPVLVEAVPAPRS